jgi:methylenetetrahydrofolate reductase (NADPH)
VIAANVPDGQAVSAQMSPLAAARLLLDEGLEPVLTLQCRDRNGLALQSDLIGAAALGVRNVLCLTGDTPAPGAAHSVRAVFELDSVALLGATAGLAAGRLLDGRSLRGSVPLVAGAAGHPFAATLHERVERLQAKLEARARFIQTQYVFDVAGFAAWLAELRAAGLVNRSAIIASVGPLRSQRVMAFLRALPGVRIPETIERRFARLREQEFARQSLDVCADTARELAALPGVAGIHVMAPYWEERIPEIIDAAGLSGRTVRA